MKSALIGQETYRLKTFQGTTLIRDYMRHRNQGWKIFWLGDGKITMVSPKPTKVWRRSK